jgi:hypothetical protein
MMAQIFLKMLTPRIFIGVDRILHTRTLRPSRGISHKTNKYNGILDLDE